MIEAINKLQKTEVINGNFCAMTGYNYGLKLIKEEVEKSLSYEEIIKNMEKLLTLVITDFRFSDECIEGAKDAYNIVMSKIQQHETYLTMCEHEFRNDIYCDYLISKEMVILYHEDMDKQMLSDSIDDIKEVINSYGLWYKLYYDDEREAEMFEII